MTDERDSSEGRELIEFLPADAIWLGIFEPQDGNPQGTFPPLVAANGIIEPGHSVNWWAETNCLLLLISAYPDAIQNARYPGLLEGDWKFLGATTPSTDTRTARIPKYARVPDDTGNVAIDVESDEKFVIVTSEMLLQRRAAFLVRKDAWDDFKDFKVVLS